MTAYYNEIDPYAAQWLRNLISAGLIASGDVDERSIEDVTPNDVAGYVQCHFFAGIGGWSYALRLAGWPDDRPVWTGSCPCQPFSAAGQRGGFADERHLWPTWFWLIRQRRPPVIFGEQVASAVGHGWLDLVYADLESAGYACGVVNLSACSVGAPHKRERLWFVANAADFRRKGMEEWIRESEKSQIFPWSSCDWLPCRDGKIRPVEPGTFPLAHGIPGRVGRLRAYGNAIVPQVAAEVIKAYMETLSGAQP